MKKLISAVVVVIFVVAGVVLAPRGILRHSLSGVTEQSSLREMSPEEIELARDIYALQQLVEEALTWRYRASDMVDRMKARERSDQPYSAKDIQALHQDVDDYLEHRDRIMRLAEKYEWFGDDDRKFVYNPGGGTSGIEKDDRGNIVIDPLDTDGQLTLRRIKLSLAAALTLYDNYLITITPFQNSKKLRRLIDYDHRRFRLLTSVTTAYLNVEKWKKVQRGIMIFELDQGWRSSSPAFAEDNRAQYLEVLIRGSYSYDRLRNFNVYRLALERAKKFVERTGDSLLALGSESAGVASQAFGNAVGTIQVRDGKLKSMAASERESIEAGLKPLDVLLEKTPFRLTDKFIPGHFGHVAIWVGTPQQLQDLGIWDHKLVRKHHKALLAGHSVLEALRPGVMLNTFQHFLDIDDLAVIRHKEVSASDERTRQHLLRAFAQVGKEYDFNFDVETDKRIVCSELAYVVFTDDPDLWPTQRSIGRATISPDHVAVRAQKGGPFEIVLFYHDGMRVDADRSEPLYTALLRNQEKEIEEMRKLLVANRSSLMTSPSLPMSSVPLGP